MLKRIRLRAAGGSVSARLPKAMADRLGLSAGDEILAVETADGIVLMPYDADTVATVEQGRGIAVRYASALRELE